MHLDYLVLRTIRHYLPDSLTRGLLRRGLIIRPGLETSDPQAAMERYTTALAEHDRQLGGQNVMVFGYGGRFGVGCGLLAQGALHVTLCDPFAPPDERLNRALLPEYERYLSSDSGQVRPRPEFITLLQADVRDETLLRSLPPQDLIVSSSVYEHLDDAAGITMALQRLTARGGVQLHFIDLRDHYFKYPFEMLCFDEGTWKRWLNPGSNLNRLRYRDYQTIFERNFKQVELEILARDPENFSCAKARIRPEFLTGDPQIDAVTAIRVFASTPKAL